MPGALLTDHYELVMAASYLGRGMNGRATFSLFARSLPTHRGFLVACGLQPCLEFLESFSFDDDEIAYLQNTHQFTDEALDAFSSLRFTGDVWAVPEGTIVLAGEPILEVTAPLPEAQLVETYLLNQITWHTSLASKAARVRVAAGDRPLVDFGFRRAPGLDAAAALARAAVVAGFESTSNVAAGRDLGIGSGGTMAHSYVEAFEDERAAFEAFASDCGGPLTFLVDTYDTLSGVRTAIEVIRERALRGPLAIRLDSGDLAQLAKDARELLDGAGLEEVKIFASGGLDEFAIRDLLASGAPIDAFGPGTSVALSADAPVLETAYKLVEYAGRATMKLSEGKVSPPGAKQVFRRHPFEGDILALRSEECRPPA